MGGAQKKKAIKFIKKGNLAKKIQQRNHKKKIQSLREKKKTRYEDDSKRKVAPVAGTSGKKEDASDMLNDMDVDAFLNDAMLDSDVESESGDEQEQEQEQDKAQTDDAAMDDDDDEGSSEEEDEDALDPRYMTSFPEFDDEAAKADDDDEQEDDDDAVGDADVPMDQDNGDAEAKPNATRNTDRTVVTMEMLIAAEKACFDDMTIAGVRRMVKIFADACHSADADDGANKAGEIAYDVQSSAVYNRLMLNVFKRMHVTFAKLVDSSGGSAEENSGAKKVDERKWKKHSLLIKRFFSCVIYILTETTGHEIQTFVLGELGHYVRFVVPCAKTPRRLLRALLKVWSKTANPQVCMLAFVRIRDLALQVPFPFLEMCLKGMYLAYTRNTKFTNEMTLPHHILLGNCVVELYGLDLSSSYQHAFIYIRELAIAIRKTIVSPSPETFKAVLNWQFFNQLRLWTAVVCAYPEEKQLRPLVYPLCQLLFAVVRLSSTIRYAPMRFQCVKLLQQLAMATDSFVPTAPALLEILGMPPFSTSYRGAKGKHSGGKDNTRLDLDLELSVKLSKAHLENRRVHDQLVTRLFELLQRECDVYKFNIGFPEWSVPLLLSLQKFSSSCMVSRWNALAKGLIETLKKRADWIRAKRSNVDICPKDLAKVKEFMQAEREAAVKQVFASDVASLQQKLAAHPSKKEDTANRDSDSEDEGVNSADNKKKSNKRRKRKSKQQGDAAATIDDATYAKVKNMSLEEFNASVAAVDGADVVEDMNFSDDE